jgi:uncharacterized protein (DUF39 family)
MKKIKNSKTIQEINEKIKQGKAVVVTAEEMIDIVERHGDAEAARRVDVVTTGTFAPMCSSGAFLNVGHTAPRIKADKMWLNDVAAYGGLAAVDCYIGATEVAEGDPRNSVYPGEFNYGGGHVIQDLVAGNVIRLRMEGYGTDCYPARKHEKNITLHDLRDATLFNPRNAYQNYSCAVNMSDRTIYTYMGMLRPRMANANYATSAQLSPLFNDPFYKTIGIGTRIFLGGAQGFVSWHPAQSGCPEEQQRRSPGGGRNDRRHRKPQGNEPGMAGGRQHAGIRGVPLCGYRHPHSDPQRRNGAIHFG